MTEAHEIRRLALEVAKGAGKLLLSTAAGKTTSKSSPTDLVTEADRAAEEYIVGRIRTERPKDSVIAEEGFLHDGTSGVTWVIDPLDGTINFVYGIPQWCVSIGIEGTIRTGVIYDPLRDETFTDQSGLKPSEHKELTGALIGTGFSYSAEMRKGQAEVLRRVIPVVRDVRRAGSCALDLAWVAAGRLDGFYEDDTHHWDVSAGIALIESAGGHTRRHDRLTIAAGTNELLEELERLVLEEKS
ncbi:MAG: inositol monophosphatase [Actinobacteria bacterium]|nr:inositol monophosphatase [Actinomycetota bacterium]